ncbi:MAG: hypothetical protein LBF79_00740 [Dysgonamonadaceae bacterium]|nr:hypothetical protein [Dysgonamonadaceae bacterium]
MRLFIFVLAACILFVSAAPCCLDGLSEDSACVGERHDDHAGDSGCGDGCSPFCVCDSCHGFSAAAPVYGDCVAGDVFARDFYDAVFLGYSLTVIRSVWRPPLFS